MDWSPELAYAGDERAVVVETTDGRTFTGYFTGICAGGRSTGYAEDWEFIDCEWADSHPVEEDPPDDKLLNVEPHEIASATIVE